MAWSPEGRRRRGRHEVKWEKEVESEEAEEFNTEHAIKGKV